MQGPDCCAICLAVPEAGEECFWQWGQDHDGVVIGLCWDCASQHPELLLDVSAADLLRLRGDTPEDEWDIALAELRPAR